MRVAVLFSGGKDSTFCTYIALKQGWDVRYLVTIKPANEDSWMFHHPCIELTGLQAEAMGIEHVVKETAGEKEKELKDLISTLEGVKDDIDAVVSGAIASRYQKDRIDAICKELGVESISPLWRKDQLTLLNQQIDAGFDIIFTGVSTGGMGKEDLGAILDSRMVEHLKALKEEYDINIAGEGGEYETFVMDGPIFQKRVVFEEVEREWDDETGSGYIICKGAKLIDK